MEYISSDFYARVLELYNASGATPAGSQEVWSLLLSQMLAHFDPPDTGMLATVAVCMPPCQDGSPVQTLRKFMTRGNQGWKRFGSPQMEFYGSNSLVGQAVQKRRNIHATNYDLPLEQRLTNLSRFHPRGGRALSILSEPDKGSLLIFPIMRAQHVAGTISLLSVMPRISSENWHLGFRYAELAGAFFTDAAFFPPEQIQLKPLVSAQEQQIYIGAFQEMMNAHLRQIARDPAHPYPVEEQIWQEIEGRLISASQDGTA